MQWQGVGGWTWAGWPAVFALGFFKHVDILWNILRFHVLSQHLHQKVDEITQMKSTSSCIEVVDELLGSNIGVE